jgi:putative endonuclease
MTGFSFFSRSSFKRKIHLKHLLNYDDNLLSTPLLQPSSFVYILTNARKTTLYVGVTTDLRSRLWEHRTRQSRKSFTARYNISILIYYETFDSITDAIDREKYIKGKNRSWKEERISAQNPQWRDLTEDVNSLI